MTVIFIKTYRFQPTLVLYGEKQAWDDHCLCVCVYLCRPQFSFSTIWHMFMKVGMDVIPLGVTLT
jgi:hypothetical protein